MQSLLEIGAAIGGFATVVLAVITYLHLRVIKQQRYEIEQQRKESAKPELYLSMATHNSARAVNVARGTAYNIRVELEHPKDSRLNVKNCAYHVLTPMECIFIKFKRARSKFNARLLGTQLYIKVKYDGLYEKDLYQRLEITDKVEFPQHPVFPEKCKETVVL